MGMPVLKADDIVKNLVGLEQGEASIILEQHSFVLRVTQIDGADLECDADGNLKRVNVAVKDDTINEVFGIY